MNQNPIRQERTSAQTNERAPLCTQLCPQPTVGRRTRGRQRHMRRRSSVLNHVLQAATTRHYCRIAHPPGVVTLALGHMGAAKAEAAEVGATEAEAAGAEAEETEAAETEAAGTEAAEEAEEAEAAETEAVGVVGCVEPAALEGCWEAQAPRVAAGSSRRRDSPRRWQSSSIRTIADVSIDWYYLWCCSGSRSTTRPCSST